MPMKMLLNNQEINTEFTNESTVGTALCSVQDYIAEDQVISAIYLDGEPLTAELLKEWKNRPVEDFCEARIEAPKRKSLAAQGLRLLAQGLADSGAEREEIGDLLSQGQPARAMDKLGEYLGLWNNVQQTLASAARLMETDLDNLEIRFGENGPAKTAHEHISDLSTQLQEIKNSLEAQDLVLLGDILEYEFGPLTENWQGMLEQLADSFEEDR
ncbi:MAG: hypothetical protein JXD22_02505 [Sedimentisphaerales bacterium]|nr:hypothetical protein [Sedimentisphaerales bacterium]